MFVVALGNLRRRKRRAILGILSIALIVGLFLALESLSGSFVRSLMSHIYKTQADVWVMTATSFSGTSGSYLDLEVREHIVRHRGVSDTEPGITITGRASWDDLDAEATLVGYEPGGASVDVTLAEGRMPSAATGMTVPEAVIDESAKAPLRGIEVGDRIEMFGREFAITGFTSGHQLILGPVVLTPIDAARDVLGLGADQASIVLVNTGDGVTADEVRAGLQEQLGSGYRVRTNDEVIEGWERQMAFMGSMLSAITSLAFLIGALVMTIIVYISVVERTHDIGVLKALGATNRSVQALVVAEAFTIAVPGFVIGAALGVLMASAIPAFMPIQTELPVSLFVRAGAITATVTVLGSLVGMRRAVSVDPIVALRTV